MRVEHRFMMSDNEVMRKGIFRPTKDENKLRTEGLGFVLFTRYEADWRLV